ncbi:MAG TPA: SPOR domain-containing protein [Casimicrobiaceae bacterium]|jgi:hypothetical protein|nr:SPOR domain-containing protein [Casimicrobiaceae bacterium]
MRTLLVLLLLANLTLLGYTLLDRRTSGEGVRLQQQVHPDKIKLLSPREVAQLGPAKIAALPDVCLEWGPFGDADRTRALADLEPLALGKLLTQRRIESSTAFWVYVPPLANKAAAETRAAVLRAAGVKDLFVVDSGRDRFAISLGNFRTEEAANAYLAELAAKNVSTARVGQRQLTTVSTLLVIRDPREPVMARLREIAPSYPGSEAKLGSCEKPG